MWETAGEPGRGERAPGDAASFLSFITGASPPSPSDACAWDDPWWAELNGAGVGLAAEGDAPPPSGDWATAPVAGDAPEASTEELGLSAALQVALEENERLRRRVRELERMLAFNERSRGGSREDSEDGHSTAASESAVQPSAKSQRVVVGFAYLTKTMALQLKQFLTISDGAGERETEDDWGDVSSGSVEKSPPAWDEGTHTEESREGVSTASPGRYSSQGSPGEGVDRGESGERPGSGLARKRKRVVEEEKEEKGVVMTGKRRSGVRKAAATTAMYSVFVFFALMLLVPALRAVGLVPAAPWDTSVALRSAVQPSTRQDVVHSPHLMTELSVAPAIIADANHVA